MKKKKKLQNVINVFEIYFERDRYILSRMSQNEGTKFLKVHFSWNNL